jgi:hypothetical protein
MSAAVTITTAPARHADIMEAPRPRFADFGTSSLRQIDLPARADETNPSAGRGLAAVGIEIRWTVKQSLNRFSLETCAPLGGWRRTPLRPRRAGFPRLADFKGGVRERDRHDAYLRVWSVQRGFRSTTRPISRDAARSPTDASELGATSLEVILERDLCGCSMGRDEGALAAGALELVGSGAAEYGPRPFRFRTLESAPRFEHKATLSATERSREVLKTNDLGRGVRAVVA